MKNLSLTSASFKVTILLCCCFPIILRAQKLEEENAKVMNRMDTEIFKGKVVLNKAIVLDHQLEPFRKREKDKDGAYRMNLDPGMMQQLFDLSERGGMEEKKKPEGIDRIQKRTRDEITASNVIPIGIINMDAILLTEEQVQDNIKAKEEGKKADASKYENIELIAAGPLQDEI